jgi:hypothetical protein
LKNQTHTKQLKKNLFYKKTCKIGDFGHETEINSEKRNWKKNKKLILKKTNAER